MSTPKKHKFDVDVREKHEFFERGRSIAKKADKGSKLDTSKTIWFEDPKDLLKFICKSKFDLIDLIRGQPRSISELAKALKRNRSSVTRDVNTLEKFGLVESEMIVNAGHGRARIVKPISECAVTLQIKF